MLPANTQNNPTQDIDATYYYVPDPTPTPIRTLLNHLALLTSSLTTQQPNQQEKTFPQQDIQHELLEEDQQDIQHEMEDDHSSLPDLTEDEDEDEDEDEENDEEDEDEEDSSELLDTANKFLKHFKHTPKIKTSPSNLEKEEEKGKFIGTIDGEVTALKCFEALYSSIEDELLLAINNRRKNRYVARQTKEGHVGHPVTNIDKYEDDRAYYLKRYKDDFTKQDVRTFLSCFLVMGVVKMPKVDNYWTTPSFNGIGMGFYFQHRMPKHKFLEIFRCLDCDVDKFQGILCNTFRKVWQLGKVISQDESMMKITARGNPHHVNMPKKPIKNGNKFYTSADSRTFIGYFHMHKRTALETEDEPIRKRKKTKPTRGEKLPVYSSTQAVTDAMDHIAGINHIYIVDRYYGSEKLAHEAMQRGQHLIGTCTANRSSTLFKNGLHKLTPNELGAVLGELTVGNDDLEMCSIYAVTVLTKKGKKHNVVTTLPPTNEYVSVQDNNLESSDQSLAGQTVPEVCGHYNSGMGHVDAANKSIATTMYPHKLNRWRVACLVWMLSVIGHDAWVIFNSKSTTSLTKTEFVMRLSKELHCVEEMHKLESLEPGVRQKCKVHYLLDGNRTKNCKHKCTICGSMCEDCFNTRHAIYLLKKMETSQNKK